MLHVNGFQNNWILRCTSNRMTWFSEPNKKVKWCICGGNVSFIYSFYIITKPGRQSEKLSAGKKIKLFYWAPLFHLLVQIPHCQNQNYFQTKVNTCSRSTGGAFHSTASFYEQQVKAKVCHRTHVLRPHFQILPHRCVTAAAGDRPTKTSLILNKHTPGANAVF